MADQNIRPTGACEQCGAGFVRTYITKRFCSDQCQRRNTACACRRCNILKGDKLIGQPLLFG